MKRMRLAVLAGALGTASGAALATPCDSALSLYQSAVASGNTTFAAQVLSNHPECFGGSATTSQAQISGTSFTQIAAISNALGLRFASEAPGPRADARIRGMAAGGARKAWNVWGSAARSDTRQSYIAANGFVTTNDSDITNIVVGADYSLRPTLVLGISAAFDNGDTSGINSSPGDVLKIIDTDGYTIAPYIGWQLSKDLVLDASFGLGRGEFNSNQNTKGESDRWFAAANLGYERWVGNIQFTGKAGYLRGVEDYDDLTNAAGAPFVGTAAKNTLGQLRLAAQAGYWMNGIMPYASIGFSSDVERKSTQFAAPGSPIGRDAWVWSIGANFFSLESGLTGGIAYRREEGRSNQKNDVLTANLGIRF